jgi:hypothetical protein
MRWLLAAVLGTFMVCAGAQDRRYAYQADLERPVRAGEFSAGGVAWRCKDGRCTALGRGGNVTVKGCSALARAVGPIKRYASEIKSLSAEDLVRCNAEVAARDAPRPAAKPPAQVLRTTAPELVYTGVARAAEEKR